jgi:hypothetical protein
MTRNQTMNKQGKDGTDDRNELRDCRTSNGFLITNPGLQNRQPAPRTTRYWTRRLKHEFKQVPECCAAARAEVRGRARYKKSGQWSFDVSMSIPSVHQCCTAARAEVRGRAAFPDARVSSFFARFAFGTCLGPAHVNLTKEVPILCISGQKHVKWEYNGGLKYV